MSTGSCIIKSFPDISDISEREMEAVKRPFCFPKCEDIKVTDSDPLPPIRLSYQSACTFGARR